jgi:type I restriction enzyme S subunit
MEVRKGYKQTDIGVIPEDWRINQLRNVALFKSGKSHEDKIDETGDYFLITLDSLDINGRLKSSHKRISRVEVPLSKDDLVMILSDVAHGYFLGLTDLIPEDDKYILNQRVGVIKALANASPRFLSFYINYRQSYFKTTGQGSSQQNLSKGDILNFPVLTPPLAEQEAIAEALSDADALIESLETLLAKKRQVKQGAMSELLTGKRRVVESGEWKVKRLGELSEMGSGGTPLSSNPDYYNGNIPWVSIADMTKSGKFISTTENNLTVAGLNSSSARMFPKGTVLYAMYASLGECSIADVPLCTSQAILGIRVKSDLSNEFLYYFLSFLKPQVKTMGQQGTQSNLNKGMVQNFELKLPPLAEQTAIAEILSDMDAEIRAVEEKLSKARAVKAGMMSELLSGRIRLVVESGEWRVENE